MKLFTVKEIKANYDSSSSLDLFSSFDLNKAINFAKKHYAINAFSSFNDIDSDYYNVNIECSIIEQAMSSFIVWTTNQLLQEQINKNYKTSFSFNELTSINNKIILEKTIPKYIVSNTLSDIFNDNTPIAEIGVNSYADFFIPMPDIDLHNIESLFSFPSLNEQEIDDEYDRDLYYLFEEPLLRKD